MKIIFMGTPDFAVGTLEGLIEAGHQVVLAVTQPDKPKGRGKAMQSPPVKVAAEAHNIPVFQPEKVRRPECVEELKKYEPQLIVVAAFGQILPKEILEMPQYGCINVHASLLPKYRGAAPIQWAVIEGEEYAGVTIMQMDVGLDTGDMISQVKVKLDKKETGGSLFDKLAVAGASLCVQTIADIEAGTAVRTKQSEEEATHVGMISKQMGELDFSKPAAELERLIRGLNPWPSAYTWLNGKNLKIWEAETIPGGDPAMAGTVAGTDGSSIWINTGNGILVLKEVQLEGKKRMSCDAFLRGYEVVTGMYLGNNHK